MPRLWSHWLFHAQSHVFTVPVTIYTRTWALPLCGLLTTDVAAQKKKKKKNFTGGTEEVKTGNKAITEGFVKGLFAEGFCLLQQLPSVHLCPPALIMGAYRDLNPRLQKSGRSQQGKTTPKHPTRPKL